MMGSQNSETNVNDIHLSKPQREVIPGVQHTVAIASGKGGVGKSTTTVNLALALAAQGARVGLLDADIYGPNQPKMLGANQQAENESKRLLPIEAHGLKTMSIGYLIDTDTPVVWRGPMIAKMLEQLLRDTAWGELDYLLIDLPPGTGDVQLTLSKRFHVDGALIVTTPQDVALLDARKALEMFRKVDVPVLGVIENMSMHVCSQCGHEEALFGAGGGERLATDTGLDVLGRLPLLLSIREASDAGLPIVKADPDSPATHVYFEVALRLKEILEKKRKSKLKAFPDIVVG